MTQWHVEVICKDAILLAFLTTCLQEPSCTVVEKNSERFYILEQGCQPLYRSSDLPEAKQDKHYYWLSTDYDEYTDAQDVLRDAQLQIPFLNSILRLKYGIRISAIQTGNVYRAEQDRLIKETALFPPITGRRATSVSLLQTINAQHPNMAALWQAAQKYPEVEESMQHFANQWNWFNLYKAYEVIMKETRRLEVDQKIKKGTFDKWTRGRSLDFEQSAHKERHSSLGYRPKRNVKIVYMSLSEATEFVTHLFFEWLQTKPL